MQDKTYSQTSAAIRTRRMRLYRSKGIIGFVQVPLYEQDLQMLHQYGGLEHTSLENKMAAAKALRRIMTKLTRRVTRSKHDA